MSVEPIEEQHLHALKGANRVRVYRAELKRNIGKLPREQGLRRVADILDSPPNDDLRKMRAGDLLGAIERVGPAKVRSFLNGRRRNEFGVRIVVRDTTLGSLTERERAALAKTLRTWAA